MRFVGIGGGSSVGIAAGGFVLWSAWGCIRESVLSSMVLRFRYTQRVRVEASACRENHVYCWNVKALMISYRQLQILSVIFNFF